ncbi:MAG TPA: hypothetical protein VFM00_11945 [Candidatus Eisenbacteria bacterium]|nr:hypothetical protein [Candidatus Eisenbacteria bacterium]
MIRDAAGIVRAAAQAAQRRDQIVRFLPTGFPGRRFPFSGFSFSGFSFGGLSFGSLSFGDLSFGSLSFCDPWFRHLSLDPGDPRGMALQGGIQARDPRLLALPCHEPGSERVLGCVLIVGAAPEAQAINGGNAAAREDVDMVELEEAAGRAPMSVRDELGLSQTSNARPQRAAPNCGPPRAPETRDPGAKPRPRPI